MVAGWLRLLSCARCAAALALLASLSACSLFHDGSLRLPAPDPDTQAPADAGPAPSPVAPADPATDPAPGAGLSAALDRLDQTRARPLTLDQAWTLALSHDPTWLADTSARLSTDTFRAQGRAALLPQIQAGYTRNSIKGLQRQPGLFNLIRESELQYDSVSTYVQLQQPVFDAGRYFTWRWAQARADQGDAEWQAARQDLAGRLADAWVGVLGARDALRLRQSLADSLAEQAAAQQALFRHDEGSITDAQQTQARLATARADVIAAQADLDVAREALEAIVGVPIGDTPDARQPVAVDEAPPQPLRPAQLVDWLDMARSSNADIAAQRARLRVAEAEVSRAASRHAPTLALIASWAKADSENLSSLSQRTNTYAVGLRLNLPLFSGGYDSALHAQTRAQARQASHTLDATLEDTLAAVMRHYQEVTGGAQRILALESSVESADLSLQAARKTYEYGQGSNLDVLRTQDRWFNVRSQLDQARLDHLRARIALQAAAGIPLETVFADAP